MMQENPSDRVTEFERIESLGQPLVQETLDRLKRSIQEKLGPNGNGDSPAIESIIATERTFFRDQIAKAVSPGTIAHQSLLSILAKVPARPDGLPEPEMPLISSRRLAIATSLATLLGLIPGVTCLEWLGWNPLGMTLALVLPAAAAGLTVWLACAEFSSSFKTKLIAAGVLTLTAGAAHWMLSRSWVSRLSGLFRRNADTPRRWGGRLLIVSGFILLAYLCRLWVRAGARPSRSSGWLDRLLDGVSNQLESDMRLVAAWCACSTSAPERGDGASKALLVELFDQFRHAESPVHDSLQELFAVAGLMQPENGRQQLVFDEQFHRRVVEGEVELVGDVGPGQRLQWVRLPVIQIQHDGSRHVCRSGRVEKVHA